MELKSLKENNGTIVKHSNVALFRMYISEIANYKPLTKEEEVELFKKYNENNDEDAFYTIWKHNLLFVVSVARKYAAALKSPILTMEDLVTDGNIGLHDAIKKFDHTKGFKFISYAVWHIRARILDSVNKNIKVIKVPIKIKSELDLISEKLRSLEQERGESVNDLEAFDIVLSEEKLSFVNDIKKFEDFKSVNTHTRSLNVKIGEDENMDLVELLSDNSPNPEDILYVQQRKDIAHLFLNKVSKEVYNFIVDYYGFYDKKQLNYKEIGLKYGKTAFYVKYSIEKELKRLKIKNKSYKNILFKD